MSEPRSLTADLRASIEARKEIHPLEFRLANLEKRDREKDTAMRGLIWQENLCVGYVRESAKDMLELRDLVVSQRDEIAGLKAAFGALQADLAAACERIENMAQWAKTKGKQ